MLLVPHADHLADQPILLEEDHLCPPALHPLEETLILERHHHVVGILAECVHVICILVNNFLGDEIVFFVF